MIHKVVLHWLEKSPRGDGPNPECEIDGVFDQPHSQMMLRLKKSSHDCGASGIILLQQVQGSGDATKEYLEADP